MRIMMMNMLTPIKLGLFFHMFLSYPYPPLACYSLLTNIVLHYKMMDNVWYCSTVICKFLYYFLCCSHFKFRRLLPLGSTNTEDCNQIRKLKRKEPFKPWVGREYWTINAEAHWFYMWVMMQDHHLDPPKIFYVEKNKWRLFTDLYATNW